jgi:peptide/nickel transport system substrate-binding protein
MEVKVKNRILLISLATLLAVSSVAIGCPRPVVVEPPVVPRVITFAGPIEAPTLDNHVTLSGTSHNLILMVNEGLLRLRPGSFPVEIEGVLAESWEVSECLTIYTFHLRQGIYFTDGAPFNAEAVEVNIRRVQELGFGPAGFLGVIEEVNVIDTYTVEFVLPVPCIVFPYLLAAWTGPQMISPKAIAEHATADDPWATKWLHDNMVGTGPFILKERIPGERTVLVRNENWWRGWGEDYIDKFVKLIIPEYATRKMMLFKGEVDIISHHIPAVELPILEAQPGIVVDYIPTINVKHIRFNFGEEVMHCKYLRTALSWAFPYDEVVQLVGPGTVQGHGPMPALIPGHCDEVFMFHTDLDKAREYLAKAGFQPGELTLTYAWNTPPPLNDAIAKAFYANLKAIGIEVELVPMAWGVYKPWLGGPKEGVELFFHSHWGQFPEATNQLALHFECSPYRSPWPPFGWRCEALNELLITARHTPCVETRLELYRQAQHLIMDAVVSIYAVHWAGWIATSDRVGGWVTTLGHFGVWHNYRLYLRNDGQ